ncbi:acyl-CoA N-acyltransferase [Scheffersomyces coipomensis]|uniref:acyl-CoA N-acyltransferase n=1 Tax=Scheffersomyces coipomensis TaxID=1788519 RepID=UPI00315D4B5E
MVQDHEDQLILEIDSNVEYIFEYSIDHWQTIHKPISKLSSSNLKQFLDLVDDNLHQYYEVHHGKLWKDDKRDEMQEDGLIYVWYEFKGELVGFISFKLVDDEEGIDGSVFYLYEIQIKEKFRGQKIGTKLMKNLENLVIYIRTKSNDDKILKINQLQQLSGIALTVFSQNKVAFEWYIRLGFKLSPSSPRDKVLRNGKVLKPDYYILYKSC